MCQLRMGTIEYYSNETEYMDHLAQLIGALVYSLICAFAY